MKEGYTIKDQEKPHFITCTVVDWIDVFTRKVYKDIQTVATALSKSDNDGDKSEHPKALDKLREIANIIWKNHIIKKINL